MKLLTTYLILLTVVLSCGSSKEFTERQNEEYRALQELVASKSFEIVSTHAMPIASASFNKVANSRLLGPGNSANYIDISSNSNHLKIKGDTIHGYFPFFGDRNFGGGYGRQDAGIEFQGVPQDYRVIPNDKKHTVDIRFQTSDKNQKMERYEVVVTLFPNLKSTIMIRPTTRSAIEYTGRVSAVGEDKAE